MACNMAMPQCALALHLAPLLSLESAPLAPGIPGHSSARLFIIQATFQKNASPGQEHVLPLPRQSEPESPGAELTMLTATHQQLWDSCTAGTSKDPDAVKEGGLGVHAGVESKQPGASPPMKAGEVTPQQGDRFSALIWSRGVDFEEHGQGSETTSCRARDVRRLEGSERARCCRLQNVGKNPISFG